MADTEQQPQNAAGGRLVDDSPSFGEQFHGKGCRPCRFESLGVCNWGSQCKFCHSPDHKVDAVTMHNRGMCRPCRALGSGEGCAFGDRCHFCHDQSHLDGTAPPPMRRFDDGGFRRGQGGMGFRGGGMPGYMKRGGMGMGMGPGVPGGSRPFDGGRGGFQRGFGYQPRNTFRGGKPEGNDYFLGRAPQF